MPNSLYGQNAAADAVSIPALTLGGDFSICFKARFDSITDTGGLALLGMAGGFNNYYFIQFYATTVQFTFIIDGSSQLLDSVPKSGWVFEDTWQSWIVVRKFANDTLDLYIDNVTNSQISDPQVSADFVVDQLFRMTATQRPWGDRIFDFQIYSTALDSAQRADVGNYRLASGATLEAWWQMQGRHPTVLNDFSGNGRHGTKSFTDHDAWHYSGNDVPFDYLLGKGVAFDAARDTVRETAHDTTIRLG